MEKAHHQSELYQDLPEKVTSLFIPHAEPELNLLEQQSTDHYLRSIDLSFEDLSKLRVVHVAGTKGKGATCAITESILRHCGYRTGLFTSPHLCDVCERVRINGAKIDHSRLLSETEWVYSRFRSIESKTIPMPRFFRLMTFVAFRIFLQEDLDVVVLEAGIGGKLDPTNFVPNPFVCGVTSIGFDHMDILGHTLGEIASEKGGIFKPGCVAFTVPQFKEAKLVLQQKASDVALHLRNVDEFADFRNLDRVKNHSVTAGFQTQNAKLAIYLAQAFERASWQHPMRSELRDQRTTYLKRMWRIEKQNCLPGEYITALTKFEWPGRFQTIPDVRHQNLKFYLDGAHTIESMLVCANWFAANHHSSQNREANASVNFLLFHCLGDRNAYTLLQALHERLVSSKVSMDHAFFSPLVSSRIGKTPGARHPLDYRHEKEHLMGWKTVLQQKEDKSAKPSMHSILKERSEGGFVDVGALRSDMANLTGDIFPSLPSALGWFRNFAQMHKNVRVEVLCTGSLYLMGDLLKLFKKAPK